ncbi:MAG: RES family NAD+ phosphorylase [Bacteroidota bacterium]|nr:RES family NAD+ phosphorylase [Bacteroidota bacterium]
MVVYRISKKLYINDLQGTGCKYESGRWHQIGTQILYTSETISLAKLEVLANANRMPIEMYVAYIDVPLELMIDEISVKELPNDWNHNPYPIKLAQKVEEWKKKEKSIALKVPSVHSPTEKNIILNPHHQNYSEVRIIKVEPISFDPRFFK